ncbi:hypothetical protein J27TS8_08910 [Robertmurraya siralis]|uniref:Uncharacterized protein n=1 Tax=Robertmurraya siralis TaxID=77777 RepID=A0A919WF96_9BACI|nr:hypothetical protein [Robertmurraya siralis]PAE22388.1 hypothetical protein CHH80_01625 [Bacillus sp. 7504-2]GIN60898.1 hypothetical protein J27TS8_08910 [Robertmurraya siralis]
MQQVVNFDDQFKEKIVEFEKECEKVCAYFENKYQKKFQNYDLQLLIEFTRTIKGKMAKSSDIYDDDYQSFIEVGIEKDEEYYPNAYIPIWRCKMDLFQKIGYFTDYDIKGIKRKILLIIEEMLEEKVEDNHS